jgi:hypothetical protein
MRVYARTNGLVATYLAHFVQHQAKRLDVLGVVQVAALEIGQGAREQLLCWDGHHLLQVRIQQVGLFLVTFQNHPALPHVALLFGGTLDKTIEMFHELRSFFEEANAVFTASTGKYDLLHVGKVGASDVVTFTLWKTDPPIPWRRPSSRNTSRTQTTLERCLVRMWSWQTPTRPKKVNHLVSPL